MQRTNIYLSEEQLQQLDARAGAEGLSRAELVRRILDQALSGESARRDTVVAAVEGAFGVAADEDWAFEREAGAREAHLERMWAT